MTSDWELLERFAKGKDQAAFAEIVQRHVLMVHGAARRMLGASGRDAEDVVQAVFLLLSQKAGRIPQKGAVAGWLFKATRYCCANVKRRDAGRQRHEREAGMQRQETAAVSDELAPLLDEALGRLGEKERQAILLRYLEGRTMEETGAVLGISADAVKKRLERGVEKLRGIFASKGFVVPAAGVAGVMLAESAKAAPAGLGLSVASAASGSTRVGAATIAEGAAVMMKMALVKMVVGIVCASLFFVAGAVAMMAGARARGASIPPVAESQTMSGPASAPDLGRHADDPFKVQVEHRLAGLQNIVVNFDATIEDTPDLKQSVRLAKEAAASGMLPPGLELQIDQGRRQYRESFAFLRGLSRYDMEMAPATVAQLKADHLVGIESQKMIFELNRVDTLIRQVAIGEPLGTIKASEDLPEDSVLDLALGMRRYGDRAWPKPADLAGCVFSTDSDSRLVIAEWTDAENYTHAWTYDSRRHFAIVSYTLKDQGGRIVREISCQDFALSGGLELPQNVVEKWTNWQRVGKGAWTGHLYKTTRLTHIKYDLADPTNTPDNFRMLWPKGSVVTDERINKSFKVQSGDRLLTDEQISDLVGHPAGYAPSPGQPATRPATGGASR